MYQQDQAKQKRPSGQAKDGKAALKSVALTPNANGIAVQTDVQAGDPFSLTVMGVVVAGLYAAEIYRRSQS